MFGLLFLGDGAKIKRTPLTNIIFHGKNNPVAVLEILEFIGITSGVRIKYSMFINNYFIPQVEKL